MRTLTIISHTEHYLNSEDQIVGLASTVTEINHLLDIFDHINHIAMLHDHAAPANTLPYVSERITFIPLPALGGTNFKEKLSLIINAPLVLKSVRKALKTSDYFQFRAPTGIGVYVIPYLIFRSSKLGWFKYAGNWNQEKAPLAYQFQRWLLKKQSRPVTINGAWEDQPAHCLSFENPCLRNKESMDGLQLVQQKNLDNGLFNLCFVGRLEAAKGIGLLLQALSNLSDEKKSKIGKVNIIGKGNGKTNYRNQATSAGLDIEFHGLISRVEVHNIYKISHAIILPSASEGFPKVIAEAMNYGCLPLVSNVSSISEYIQHGINGFLCDPIDVKQLVVTLDKLLGLTNEQYIHMIREGESHRDKFTYAYYNERIITDIIEKF